MIYFFQEKQILYSFPYFNDETYVINDYIKNHQLISSLLFFNKQYKKELEFKKELFKKNNVIINLYKYNDIFLIEKIHDYSSNEYFIGIYFINLLRSIIPTFTYTFFKSNKKLWLEYNNGITLYNYIKTFQTKKIDEMLIKKEGNNYLSIFFQILCSLEVAQEQGLFTHYDLHLENIMINENNLKKELLFPIGYNEYSFLPSKYIISIIDYEYSCSRSKNKIISSIKPFLFHYGYFSIFFSGVDILRYLFSFQYNFHSLKKNLFIHKIYYFHCFILEKFYKIPIKKIDFKSLEYHSTYFFNYTFSKKIYKTPYELLIFLQNNSNFISSIFFIDSLPFSIRNKKRIYNCPDFIKPKHTLSLSNITGTTSNFLTIYKTKKEIYLEYKELIKFKESFEYFYFSKQIPIHSLQLSLKIYRYLHSMEQILLLKSIYPPTEYNYFKLNIYKVPYIL